MLLQQEGIRKRNIIIYSVKDIHRSGNFSRGGGGSCKNGRLLGNWRGLNFNISMSWYTIKNPLVIINCRIGSALAYECTFSSVSQKSLLCNILIRIGNINSSSMHHFLLKTWSSGIWPFTRAFVVSTKIFPYNCDVNSALHSYNPGTGHYFLMPYLAHCNWPSLFRIFSLKKKIKTIFIRTKRDFVAKDQKYRIELEVCL